MCVEQVQVAVIIQITLGRVDVRPPGQLNLAWFQSDCGCAHIHASPAPQQVVARSDARVGIATGNGYRPEHWIYADCDWGRGDVSGPVPNLALQVATPAMQYLGRVDGTAVLASQVNRGDATQYWRSWGVLRNLITSSELSLAISSPALEVLID
jgi:hypothetical protein